MKFAIALDDGQQLILDKSLWTGKIQVLLNGSLIAKQAWRGKAPINLSMKDGSVRALTIKNHFFDPVPIASLDGNELPTGRKLTKWETVAACWPLLLTVLCQFGALPTGLGVALVYLNFFVVRKDSWPAAARWAIIAIAPLVGFGGLIMLTAVVMIAAGQH